MSDKRRAPLTPEELKGIVADWQDGKSVQEISEAYNIKPRSLSQVITNLRKKGVPLQYRRRGRGSSVYEREDLITELTEIASSEDE